MQTASRWSAVALAATLSLAACGGGGGGGTPAQPKSADARLSALERSDGSLSPAFSAATQSTPPALPPRSPPSR